MKRRNAIKTIGVLSALAVVPITLPEKAKGGVVIMEVKEIYVGNENITLCIPTVEAWEGTINGIGDIDIYPRYGEKKYTNSGKTHRCMDGKLRYLFKQQKPFEAVEYEPYRYKST